MSERVTIAEAAERLGMDKQTLRVFLQLGRFSEFATAVKLKKWVYYINRPRFELYLKGGVEK